MRVDKAFQDIRRQGEGNELKQKEGRFAQRQDRGGEKKKEDPD